VGMTLVCDMYDYIMRSDDMQVSRMCHYLVHNHHLHLVCLVHMIAYMTHASRRDHMCNLV